MRQIYIDGELVNADAGAVRRVVSIIILTGVEMWAFAQILLNVLIIIDTNNALGIAIAYFLVTNIRFMSYKRLLRLMEHNGPGVSEFIIQRFGNKEANQDE